MTTAEQVDTNQQNIHYTSAMEEIRTLIKGRVPIIWVVTHEEARFIDSFNEQIAKQEGKEREVWLWSAWQGLVSLSENEEINVKKASGDHKDTDRPPLALQKIIDMKPADKETCHGQCFILRDFHTVLREPIPRTLRDIYEYLAHQNKTLIIVAPTLAHGPAGRESGLPPTLEKQIQVVNFDLPKPSDIREHIDDVLNHLVRVIGNKNTGKYKLNYTEEELQSFTRALSGLTMNEAEDAIASSISHLDKIDVNKLILEKKQIIKKSEILEFIESDITMNDVGGLDRLKQWLEDYKAMYSNEAKEFGVEPIKGVLLSGIPGTGKSLSAKASFKLWQVPGLRLDIGKVMSGLVGGSEGKMRQVIQQAEAMAPCVLWIDEVEKALSGTKSSNFSDGGTMSRVFGTMLTAMEEGMKGVTIVATANDITQLPPEFIRRFDEVFFVDLPSDTERWDILKIHLKKRNRDISKFEKHKAELLKVTAQFTGAEIEKGVKAALATAFTQGKKDLEYKELLTAFRDTKPIAQVMDRKINKIREKARKQYRYASSHAEQAKKSGQIEGAKGKKLDLDDTLENMPELDKTKVEKAKSSYSKDKGSRFSGILEE